MFVMVCSLRQSVTSGQVFVPLLKRFFLLPVAQPNVRLWEYSLRHVFCLFQAYPAWLVTICNKTFLFFFGKILKNVNKGYREKNCAGFLTKSHDRNTFSQSFLQNHGPLGWNKFVPQLPYNTIISNLQG